jgi:1,4-dihydroxy-2-naphthoate octaprenyltransferase
MRVAEFFHIVELRTKVISVSSFLLGTLFAVHRGAEFVLADGLLLLAATLCVDMGTTALNSFFDKLRGVDNRKVTQETDKVLVSGHVAPGTALGISAILFLCAGGLGIALAARVSWVLVPVGAVSMAVGYLYNAGPHPISRTPFGELFAGGFLGAVLFLISFFVQARSVPSESLLGALPPFFYVASVLTVNNTCDMIGDRRAGRRTLAIVAGRRVAEILLYGFGAAGHLVLLALTASGLLPRSAVPAILISAGIVTVIYFRMHRRGYSHARKGDQMNAIVHAFLSYSGAYLFALVWGILAT